LNIITTFLSNPDAFVHYIKRRIEMQRADCVIAGDEIDLFSTYLLNRLDPEEVWARRDADGGRTDLLMIAPCSDEINRWYAIEQHTQKGSKPEIGPKLPHCLEIALATLSTREDDESRYIAIHLLDLPRLLLDQVDEMVTGYLTGTVRSPLGRINVFHDEIPITILLGDGFPPEKAREALEQRIDIEAYRCKSDVAVGLFFDVKGRAIAFHTGMILEKPWAQDDAKDKFIKEEPAFPMAGQKLPDAYDPCFCGSGKKFKFCCRPRIKKQA
jgi:hypothetical protein